MTAAVAEQAGADAELVVAALFHDAAKAVDSRRHGRLIADLLGPHVRPEVEHVLRVHQDLTARRLDNGRSRHRRLIHRARPGYALAVRFVEDWDLPARDPDYPTEPLEHFQPLVDRVLARRYPPRIPLGRRLRVVAGRGAVRLTRTVRRR
jgi:predicted HD phosphohydrolase